MLTRKEYSYLADNFVCCVHLAPIACKDQGFTIDRADVRALHGKLTMRLGITDFYFKEAFRNAVHFFDL